MTRAAAVWLVALATFIVVAVGVRLAVVAAKPMAGIEIESLVVAGDLMQARQSGAHERMPGYGLMLAGLAAIDPNLQRGLACRPDQVPACGKARYVSVFVVQFTFALVTLALGFLIARRLSGSVGVAGLATALTFLATRPGDLAGFVTPNGLYQLLIVANLYLALLAWQGRSVVAAVVAGSTIGMAALIEPVALLLAPVSGLAFLALGLRQRTLGFASAAGGGLVISALATAVVVLQFSVARGYDTTAIWRHLGQRLAERVAYNDLGFVGTLSAILVPIPLLGDSLQSVFLSAAEVRKHAMYQPGSLMFDAATRLWPEMLARVGSTATALQLLWEQRVVAELGQYLGGLLPVLSRGLWGGAGVIGLIGIFHAWRSFTYARVDQRAADLAIVGVPTVALLFFNTLASANFPTLNPALPLLYAFAIAYVAGGL
jgi:hypothetical protein